MTILSTITLVAAIIVVALIIAYSVQRGTKTLKELQEDFDKNEEVKEVVKLAQELYNKDLRPIVAKKAPKKEKVEEQVENMRKVVDAHDTLVKELDKVAPKSEFPIDKPKKKRKYYPKKK